MFNNKRCSTYEVAYDSVINIVKSYLWEVKSCPTAKEKLAKRQIDCPTEKTRI
jgi:hypothetical protein